MERENEGIVYLAGAGPGKIEYMTLYTDQLLRTCDVIVYDRLLAKELLERCKAQAKKIYVGKAAGKHSQSQESIHRILIKEAKRGKKVLRLKGGDPFVFGRGPEECAALREAGIAYEVVPGITSAIAVPMAAGIPVTYRKGSRSFTVVTGHTAEGGIDRESIKAYAAIPGTLVFLMGLGQIQAICQGLIAYGKPIETPAAVICGGTTKEQYELRGNLGNLPILAAGDDRIVSPGIIVVGEAAGLDLRSNRKNEALTSGWDEDIQWGQKRSFAIQKELKSTPCLQDHSFRVLLTGTGDFVRRLSECLGEEVISVSCPHLTPCRENTGRLSTEIQRIQEYSHLIFTGRTSVRLFFETYQKMALDIRKLSGVRIGVMGEGTGKYLYENYGIQPDLIPERYDSEGLVKTLLEDIRSSGEEANVLIPRCRQGNRVLSEALEKEGIPWTELPIYHLESDRRLLGGIDREIPFDAVVFGSAWGAKSFLREQKQMVRQAKIICIGEHTAQAVKAAGFDEIWVPERADVRSVALLVKCLAKDRKSLTA